ncbi:MAG: TonB family protein [Acidobacteriaceae bacterium]|nr:TonB family protein [Acidobacteriaceae bacterium]
MFSGLPEVQEVPVRRWTAIVSFTLQATFVAVGMVYPLLSPQSLPPVMRSLFLPASNPEAPVQPQRDIAHARGSAVRHPIVVNNRRWSFTQSNSRPDDTGPAQAPDISDVIGDPGPGVAHSIMSDYVRPMPTAPVQTKPFRQSVMMEGNLIHKVEPQYPAIAKQLHIEGTVIVRAIISREGVITRAEAERGQAWLAKAALEAVRQWRYRPYYLSHEPIEVETEITVNFVLQR